MVDHVRTTWQVSIRRACQAVPACRATYHYRSRRTGQALLMKRIKEIAETRVRYGYRRIHVLLRREGWQVNAKRVCRLYREMCLQLRNKSPKRRVKAKLRNDRQTATAPNQIWAMDFVHAGIPRGTGTGAVFRSKNHTGIVLLSPYSNFIHSRAWPAFPSQPGCRPQDRPP